MSDNQRVGQGALFKNDKQGVEKRPDYTGPATILGKKFFISAWISTSQTGQKYMSLAFTESQGQNNSGTPSSQPATQATRQAPASSAPVDDEIPF